MIHPSAPFTHRVPKVVSRTISILVIVLLLLFAALFVALPGANAGDIPGGSSPTILATPTP